MISVVNGEMRLSGSVTVHCPGGVRIPRCESLQEWMLDLSMGDIMAWVACVGGAV